jgi:hypothetical protein
MPLGVRFYNQYSRLFSWSDVPAGADLVTIKPNITVSKGEHLALFITGGTSPEAGVAPSGDYCYLNKAADAAFNVETSTRTLFQNLLGNVSPKGIDGKQSPVKATGRELSWYSIVQ